MANELVGAELRKGSGFARKGQGFQLILGETWNYRVKTDEVTSNRQRILYETPGLPRAGLLYGPLGLICDEVSCEREEKHALYWNVTARFQTGTEEQKQNQENNPDPATWIPVFKIDSFATKEKVLAKDRSTPAKYPVNSAGTPFDQPLTETISLCQFSFVQFEDAGQKLKDFLDRNDIVNKSSFDALGQVFPARTLLIEVQEAELGSYAGYSAWRVKYKVTYDPDTHDEQRADMGPFWLDAADSNKRKRYMDDTNAFPIVGALNGSGARAANPATLNFRCKKEVNFDTFIRTQ
jgi:hypothetical protein